MVTKKVTDDHQRDFFCVSPLHNSPHSERNIAARRNLHRWAYHQPMPKPIITDNVPLSAGPATSVGPTPVSTPRASPAAASRETSTGVASGLSVSSAGVGMSSNGRAIIIGDIHGCLTELQAILGPPPVGAGLRPGLDTLVLVGDLINKGPESAGVVRYLRGLRRSGCNVVLVKGNHEEKLDKHRTSEKKAKKAEELRRRVIAAVGLPFAPPIPPAPPSAASASAGTLAPAAPTLPPGPLSHEEATWLRQYENLRAVAAELSDADYAFLETAVLYHRLPEHGALVVHAGVPGDWVALPRLDKLSKLSKEELRVVGRLMHCRFVRGAPAVKYSLEVTLRMPLPPGAAAADVLAAAAAEPRSAHVSGSAVAPVGAFVEDATEAFPDRFWANAYDGRFGHVYFGHSPFTAAEAPVRFPNATALDLGACSGGRLAAAVLEVGREPAYVSVKAAIAYAAASTWLDRLGIDEPAAAARAAADAVARARQADAAAAAVAASEAAVAEAAAASVAAVSVAAEDD